MALDIDTIKAFAAQHAGELVKVTTADDTTTVVLTGKVTTKGLAVKMGMEDPTYYIARTKIVSLDVVDAPADMFTDGDEYTTAELAAAFDMTARALRVELRAMGIGVGKGHTYRFTATEARRVATTLNAK